MRQKPEEIAQKDTNAMEQPKTIDDAGRAFVASLVRHHWHDQPAVNQPAHVDEF